MLPGAAEGLLQVLGVWEDMERARFPPCHGVTSAWGGEELRFSDWVFDCPSRGWRLDRRRFDALLCQAAQERGVEVRLRSPVRSCHDEAGAWSLTVGDGHGDHVYVATFVVTATGRGGAPGALSGGRRLADDRLVGLARRLEGAGNRISPTRTWIEAAPDGWWYVTLLGQDLVAVAYLTDADLLPRPDPDGEARWFSLLATAPRTSALLHDLRPLSSPRVVAAGSSRRADVTGTGWIAVGDAAMTLDPLSGQGLYWALASGVAAADAVCRALDGDVEGTSRYSAWVGSAYEEYRRERRRMYLLEQRWRSSPFWARRHGDRGPEPARR